MRGAVVAVAVLAGCYQPVVPSGVPCSDSGDCPQGQKCDQVRNVCELSGADAGPDDSPVDALIDSAIDGPPALGAWNAPVLLNSVNSAGNDTDPAISADGLEMFFASDRPGGLGALDIWRTTRTSLAATFAAPTFVVELSTTGSESAPELSGDGLTIYFKKAGEIYRATRPTTASPFANIVLDTELSSAEPDTNPAISRNGLFASVTREPTLTERELYLYTRAATSDAWGTARQLTELSTPFVESAAALSDDGLQLWFHSDRATPGGGPLDLYLATRASVSATFVAVPIPELNSVGIDSDPSLTADLRIIVFERDANLMIATR